MNTQVMFSSVKDDWTTPDGLFCDLAREFNFTVDAAASNTNAKCNYYWDKQTDGLAQEWKGHTVFCNPPYGREIGKWVRKGYQEGHKPGTTVVMLIPARTDTAWFHEYIHNKAEVRFLRGRLKFGGGQNSAPFPSMVVIWRGPHENE